MLTPLESNALALLVIAVAPFLMAVWWNIRFLAERRRQRAEARGGSGPARPGRRFAEDPPATPPEVGRTRPRGDAPTLPWAMVIFLIPLVLTVVAALDLLPGPGWVWLVACAALGVLAFVACFAMMATSATAADTSAPHEVELTGRRRQRAALVGLLGFALLWTAIGLAVASA